MNPNQLFLNAIRIIGDSSEGTATRIFLVTFIWLLPAAWVGWWIAEGIGRIDDRLGR